MTETLCDAPSTRQDTRGEIRPEPLAPRAPREAGKVRFGAQEIADAHGRVVAHELQFRWNAALQPDMLAPGEFLTSAVLANSLLDAGVAGQTPNGRLFFNLDEPTLMGPLADLVSATLGTIDLTDAVAVDTPVLMRVAQLRARGHRFSIDGLRDLDDPRWLLAPYADVVKIDLTTTRPDAVGPIVRKAVDAGLEVIGKRVESMVGYRRLAELGVSLFQGRFISPPVDVAVPALPGCDGAIVLRTQRLLSDRASVEAVAACAATDPALVMRLQILHRLLGRVESREPDSLASLLTAFPPTVLSGWMRVLLHASCHGHGAAWVTAVRSEIDLYLRRQRASSSTVPSADRAASLWEFQRRLCSPRHYLKTLRHAP